MPTIHMTEAEVARDLHTVLSRVQEGIEVVVEQDHHAVAVIRALLPKGRLLSECIALARTRGTSAVPDEGFAKDIADGVAERSKVWNPPTWE